MTEEVNHPHWYTVHPSGVECIQITEHMGFCLGSAMKYLWRAGLKTADPIKDLKKAVWYIEREIARLGKQAVKQETAGPEEGGYISGVWIPYIGGGNPAPGELVKVKFENGEISTAWNSYFFKWDNEPIVEYMVI